MPENRGLLLKGGTAPVARKVSGEEGETEDGGKDPIRPQGLFNEAVLPNKSRTEVAGGGYRVVGVVDVTMECRGLDHRLAGETDSDLGGSVDNDPHALHLRRLDGFWRPLEERFDGCGWLLLLVNRFCAFVSGHYFFVVHRDVFIRRVGINGRGGFREGRVSLLASLGMLLQDTELESTRFTEPKPLTEKVSELILE